MTIIHISGYVVRFCNDGKCNHLDNTTCPNAKTDITYVNATYGANCITTYINNNYIPLVIGHDNEGIIGHVEQAILSEQGILVHAKITDSTFIGFINNTFEIYKRDYTGDISLEQFIYLFSSISLSHNPITWEVNHIGIVNIPGRIGTEIKYRVVDDESLAINNNIEKLSEIISAHLVAYLRAPDRQIKLIRNNKFSHERTSPIFITASTKMNREIDLDKLCTSIGKQVLTNAMQQQYQEQYKPSTKKSTISQQQQQPQKRKRDDEDDSPANNKSARVDGIEDIVESKIAHVLNTKMEEILGNKI